MALRKSKDDMFKDFYREGWDIETHPGFKLSYDIHRGRKFLALDRGGSQSWFHQAVTLQESLLISPHELVAKVATRRGKLRHLNAQIAVKTIALANVRRSAEELGFQGDMLDKDVGELADEWSVQPGRDMIRYLALIMGGYSEDRTKWTIRRMRWWGKWYEDDLIEAFLNGFFEKAAGFIEEGNTLELAKLLEEAGEEAEKEIAAARAAKGEGKGGSRWEPREFEPSDKKGTPSFEEAGVRDKWVQPRHEIDDSDWWAPMQVVHPPLIAQQEIIKRVYHRKATDCGVSVSDVSRVLTDQKVFREPRPAIKGSVLVDASGSMSLTTEEIYQVMGEIPGAVIGVYTGIHREGYGKLIIAAVNGRLIHKDRMADERKNGGANMVDGPALEWLGTQPRPRVWVSDGAVTGIHENQNEHIIEDAKRLCQQHGIVRIHAMKQAPGVIKHLRARKG